MKKWKDDEREPGTINILYSHNKNKRVNKTS